MATHNRRDPAKELFWRQMLRQWQTSGLSVREFCTQQQVSQASFYFWRRIIAQRDQQAGNHMPATPDNNDTDSTSNQADASDPPLFVPVTLATPAKAEPPLELVLASGMRVRVPVGFDDSTLRQLLTLLNENPQEDAPC